MWLPLAVPSSRTQFCWPHDCRPDGRFQQDDDDQATGGKTAATVMPSGYQLKALCLQCYRFYTCICKHLPCTQQMHKHAFAINQQTTVSLLPAMLAPQLPCK
jgi:hypothetical protein